jgi:hypothetical protein
VFSFSDRPVLPVLTSVSVAPWMASLTVLVALVTSMPFTLSLAFCAAEVCLRFCTPAGSLPSRPCSAGSPSTVIRMLDFSPVCEDVSTNRLGVPLPSFTMVAVTPALALLIALRMPSSVLLPASMVIGLATWVASGVNVAPLYWPVVSLSVPPVTAPKSMVILPLPIAVLVSAWPPLMTVCACASCFT